MEAILAYVKGFLTLYLLIKVLLFLTPKNGFSKYISFFSGVILALGLLYPVMQLFSIEEKINMQTYILEEERLEMSLNADYLQQNSGEIYRHQVEALIEKEIEEHIEKAGFKVKQVEAKISKAYEIEKIEMKITSGKKEEYPALKERLLEEYQLSIEQCEIVYE